MTKKLVWFGIAVMVTLLGLAALWQFRTVVVIVLVSLAVAASVRPVARRWARQGVALRLAGVILLILAVSGIGFGLILGGGAVIREIRLLANTVAVQDEWKLPVWLQGSSIQESLATRLPPPSELFGAVIGDQGQLVLPALLSFTRAIAGIVSGFIVVLFMSLYWSLNQSHFERLWLSILPPGQRNRTRMIWQTIEEDLGAYIRSQVIQSLLAGLLLGFGYWALGSPYPALLALMGALACLIPIVGVGLAVVLPLIIGLLSSVELSLFTALYTLAALTTLVVWIKPRLFKDRQYNPVLTVAILIALANAFGLIGVIAAPPISAAIQILWSNLGSSRTASATSSRISELKVRHTALQGAIQAMEDPPLPLVTSSMERLTRLIEKAETVLQEDQFDEPVELVPSLFGGPKNERQEHESEAVE